MRVRIDRTHRRWLIIWLVLLIVALVGYGYTVRRGWAAVFGPSGGSAIGLVFGVSALVFVIFAAARILRRSIKSAMASPTFWAAAHAWLGALALPLAWLHGGFEHGGALTSVLMWLLYAVIVSGVAAALLRHYLSHPTSGRLPIELIDMPVEEAIAHLASQAQTITARSEPPDGDGEGSRAAVAVAGPKRPAAFKELYSRSIQPYLEQVGGQSILAHRVRSAQVFRRCREAIPDPLHAPLAELEKICDNCRRLRSRQRLALWVDRLMLVHVPFSAALIILGILHGVYSIRY